VTRPEEEPLPCPHCAATAAAEQRKRTALGDRTFRCPHCRRTFNERTGTPCKHVPVPTAIVLLVVLWRLRDKLRLRDLAELFLERGFVFTQETVRDGEARCAPLLAAQWRAKRRGTAGPTWPADETDGKVNGQWCSLYRAIDRAGPPVDARLSATRDMDAAQRCFRRARALAGATPAQVTTDGHDAYPRAIRATRGDGVAHRCRRDTNKRIAHDHRGLKQRYSPLRGCGSFAAAARFCTGFEEHRQYCRAQARSGAFVSLAERRRRFQDRWAAVLAALTAA